MSQDQQTYQRGLGAALLGGAVLLLVTAVLAVLGFWLGSATILAAAWHAVGGVAIWLVLAIVYQQHRLERLEALEADELARREGADSSIFETSVGNLSVSRRRLDRLYKWVLPGVSLLTGGYLIGVGLWLLSGNLDLLAAGPFAADRVEIDPDVLEITGRDPRENRGFVALVLVALAFVSFVISRYLAGMGRVREWSLLRGGAGYLMGICLVALALVLGYGLLYAPSILVLKYLAVVIPAFMILIGAEISLNLLLDIYRPRRAGEIDRPAFDSRLLSLLTAPESIARTINEAINYQFGFEITQSWFWQLLSRTFGWLVLVAAAVLIAASSIVVVEPQQAALITRFGQLTETVGPGLHVKWPWPIGAAERIDAAQVRQMAIGSAAELRAGVPILWSNEHYQGEPVHLIVAPPTIVEELEQDVDTTRAEFDPAEAAAGAPSNSLVNAEVMVQYRIRDVETYATRNAAPDQRLRDIAEATLSRFLLRRDVDAWIGAARLEAAEELRRMIQARADAAQLGIEVLAVPIASIHPPVAVADAFHQAVAADQRQQTMIEEARRYRIQQLADVAGTVEGALEIDEQIKKLRGMQTGQIEAAPDRVAAQQARVDRLVREAGGTASTTLAEALAERWTYENRERGQAVLFEQELRAFQASPTYYRMRNYLEAMLAGIVEARKYVILADREDLTLRFDLQELETGFEELEFTAGE